MASVFLSYDHDDAGRAAPVAAALEAHGHSVWWDRHIHGGAEYNSAIETAVEQSDAVVVLWSETSVRSAWVRDEAAEGRDAGKLVPVLIDAVKPPMGFRQYQTIDLGRWNGGRRIPRLPDVLQAIETVSGARSADRTVVPERKSEPRATVVRDSTQRPISRRQLLGGAAAGSAIIAGGGIWWTTRSHDDPRFKSLIDQAYDEMLKETADEKTAKVLEQAIAIQPDSAKAWGLLALLKSYLAPGSGPKDSSRLVDESEKAARRALSIDPKQPDALLAMFELEGSTLDWITRDRKLRQIVSIDPNQVGAIAELALLTAATGLQRESWDWNERALTFEPLSSDFLGKRALKLWLFGRTSESDKVIDQLRGLNPNDHWAWFVRVQIYAFTGRVGAALGLLDNEPEMHGRSPMASLWREALPALDDPSPSKIAKAREACIRGAGTVGNVANEAVLIMSALGELDTAFDIANGWLLSRGPLVPKEKPGSGQAAENAGWRVGTQWMWVPPVAAMRADPRFLPLCGGVGLTDYWRKRGVKPDFMRLRA
ncbi:MAG: toll/interleukin-1 receptor domain-containing protein [Sphingomicrobium sp.]